MAGFLAYWLSGVRINSAAALGPEDPLASPGRTASVPPASAPGCSPRAHQCHAARGFGAVLPNCRLHRRLLAHKRNVLAVLSPEGGCSHPVVVGRPIRGGPPPASAPRPPWVTASLPHSIGPGP